MTDYILTAHQFRQVLERNDQGRAIKEIKHRKGALITDLDEQEELRLLIAGAIRPAGEVPVESDTDPGDGAAGDDAPPPAPADASPEAAASAGPPRKPRATATAEKWLAYAKSLPGIDADSLDGKDKDELIALVDAAEQN